MTIFVFSVGNGLFVPPLPRLGAPAKQPKGTAEGKQLLHCNSHRRLFSPPNSRRSQTIVLL